MSKVVKQMEMTALKDSLQNVRDLVVLSIKGLTSQGEHQLRMALRKKNVRVRMVKNTLTRKVFHDIGIHLDDNSPYWQGPTALAWGGASIAETSRTLEAELRAPKTVALYRDKVTVKGAVVEGQAIPFDQALKMPTREEAIAQVLSMILGPGSAIAACLIGPASQVASQIDTLTKEKEPAADAEGAAAEAAPAG